MNIKKKATPSIGIVLNTVPKYSETFFRNKIKGLQAAGCRVVLFVDYIHADDADFDCKVVAGKNFNSASIKNLWYAFLIVVQSVFVHPKRSYRLLKQNKKDGMRLKANLKSGILYSFFLKESVDWLHFGFGMLAVHRENVAAAMHAKMAVSFRGFDLYLSPLKHPGCYDVLFTKEVQYHVLSQEMKQELLGNQIPANLIKVITPAIDTQFFTTNKSTKPDSVLQLTTVARLHWKKGLEYTLEALAILKKKGIAFQYTIIGTGEEQERLVFAAHQLGILEHITFTGKQSQSEIKKRLEQTAIYLQYSIQEGFCNAVLEAQALGVLCIVSDAEGLAENVLDTTTGWVVPKRKPEALATKIETVHTLPKEEKQNISKAAIARVQQNFGLKQQQEAFARFYGVNKEI